MPLSAQVKTARERLGLTQVQLAKLAGLSQTSISEIESGKTQDISARNLFQIADALNIDARALLSEDEAAVRPTFHDEEAVLVLYRRLSPEQRTLWKAIGQTMLHLQPREARSERPK